MPDTEMLDRHPDDPAWGHARVAGSGGVMLDYVRLGRGEPVLLLHGWPGFWYDWRRVVVPLSGIADVIAPDSRGFGIDHYLGKETVRDILALRSPTACSRRCGTGATSTTCRSQPPSRSASGIEGRGSFYERTGAMRDLISTHLFQVLTFLAMEPPVSFEPDRLRDETVKVLHATRLCEPAHVGRGQYQDFRDEDGVSDRSQVETFDALRRDRELAMGRRPVLPPDREAPSDQSDGDHAFVSGCPVQCVPGLQRSISLPGTT
jgi:Glucose-6-phosphate dehydrogenase, C-terminal domain